MTEQLYRQWKLFFSEVAGYEAAEGKLEHKKELNALAKGIGVEPAELGRRTSILFRFAHILFLGDLLRGVLTMPHAQGPVLLPLTETGG